MTDNGVIQNTKLTTFTRVVVLIALYFMGGLLGKETTFLLHVSQSQLGN